MQQPCGWKWARKTNGSREWWKTRKQFIFLAKRFRWQHHKATQFTIYTSDRLTRWKARSRILWGRDTLSILTCRLCLGTCHHFSKPPPGALRCSQTLHSFRSCRWARTAPSPGSDGRGRWAWTPEKLKLPPTTWSHYNLFCNRRSICQQRHFCSCFLLRPIILLTFSNQSNILSKVLYHRERSTYTFRMFGGKPPTCSSCMWLWKPWNVNLYSSSQRLTRGRSSTVRGLEQRLGGDAGTVEALPAPPEQERAQARGRSSRLPFLHMSFHRGRQARSGNAQKCWEISTSGRSVVFQELTPPSWLAHIQDRAATWQLHLNHIFALKLESDIHTAWLVWGIFTSL